MPWISMFDVYWKNKPWEISRNFDGPICLFSHLNTSLYIERPFLNGGEAPYIIISKLYDTYNSLISNKKYLNFYMWFAQELFISVPRQCLRVRLLTDFDLSDYLVKLSILQSFCNHFAICIAFAESWNSNPV